MGMRALSRGDFRLTTRLVSRVGWRLTMMSGAAERPSVRRGENREGNCAAGAQASRHNLVFGGSCDPDHDALMRIGGEVPRRRDHSLPRREGHGWVRVAAASDRCPARADTRSSREEETPFQSAKSGGSRGVCRDPVFDVPTHALESNNSTPTGTVPSSTKRHKSINNLRASATIIVLRTPRGPLAVRASNHLASALSFWNIKNRQASWIMPRRTRALPDRANPFSRLREPLSSGEPVRPP